MPKSTAAWLRPMLAALVGLALGVGVTAFAGENPLNVARIILVGAFGSAYDLGMTLFYTAPLILTGLAVAVPFHAGLFNIGGEGQLTLGALAVAATGILFPELTGCAAFVAAGLAGLAAGALWGGIAGWLRAYRGSHEVISTIMLNFIAAGLSSWVVLYLIRSNDTQNPETAHVGGGYMLDAFAFLQGAPVTMASLVSPLCALLVWALMARGVKGYEISATGANPEGAATAGVNVPRTRLWAMVLAGGLAGLVGLAEVCGNAGRFRMGFSPDFGFVGIPVALLARCHPLGVVASALLFGALQKGTSGLELETEFVTRDLASIIQALVVLTVSVEGYFSMRRRRGERKDHV